MSSFLVIFQHCERWDSQEKKWMETGKTEELIFHPSSRRLASTISSTATNFFFFSAQNILGCEILTIKRMHFLRQQNSEKNPLNLSRENVISFCLELTLHQSISHTFFPSKKYISERNILFQSQRRNYLT